MFEGVTQTISHSVVSANFSKHSTRFGGIGFVPVQAQYIVYITRLDTLNYIHQKRIMSWSPLLSIRHHEMKTLQGVGIEPTRTLHPEDLKPSSLTTRTSLHYIQRGLNPRQPGLCVVKAGHSTTELWMLNDLRYSYTKTSI